MLVSAGQGLSSDSQAGPGPPSAPPQSASAAAWSISRTDPGASVHTAYAAAAPAPAAANGFRPEQVHVLAGHSGTLLAAAELACVLIASADCCNNEQHVANRTTSHSPSCTVHCECIVGVQAAGTQP